MTNTPINFIHISDEPESARCNLFSCKKAHDCGHCGKPLKNEDVFGTWYQEGEQHERLYCSPCAAGVDMTLQNLEKQAESILNS